ncbi:hypothetical protein C8Q78DRAFT_1041894 [Trametes maxima]|nr:hypothetical protein C8Q78DRAFT_1041894 [Trametes maxima]
MRSLHPTRSTDDLRTVPATAVTALVSSRPHPGRVLCSGPCPIHRLPDRLLTPTSVAFLRSARSPLSPCPRPQASFARNACPRSALIATTHLNASNSTPLAPTLGKPPCLAPPLAPPPYGLLQCSSLYTGISASARVLFSLDRFSTLRASFVVQWCFGRASTSPVTASYKTQCPPVSCEPLVPQPRLYQSDTPNPSKKRTDTLPFRRARIPIRARNKHPSNPQPQRACQRYT